MQVASGEHLGEQDDLSSMVGEMFGDVEGGLQSRHLILLDGVNPRQIFDREFVQNAAGFPNRLLQTVSQCAPFHRMSLTELLVSVAIVGCAAQAGNNPLTNIAIQV